MNNKVLKSFFFALIFLSLSFASFALDNNDVERMVVELERSGIIPESEGKRVREEMKKITPQEWKEIEKIAKQYQKQMKSPNVQNNLGSAIQHINTDSDQFRKISSELEKVMKQKKDMLD